MNESINETLSLCDRECNEIRGRFYNQTVFWTYSVLTPAVCIPGVFVTIASVVVIPNLCSLFHKGKTSIKQYCEYIRCLENACT